MEQLLPVIPMWVMIAIGIALMAIEMLTMTFVLVLFGLAFIITGLSSLFLNFSSGETQLIATFFAGLILTLLLRKPLQNKIYTGKQLELETLKTGEEGEIIATTDNDFRVAYKGTTWAIANPEDYELKAGKKVQVIQLKDNKAVISEIK